jgi:hypothetical protein
VIKGIAKGKISKGRGEAEGGRGDKGNRKGKMSKGRGEEE